MNEKILDKRKCTVYNKQVIEAERPFSPVCICSTGKYIQFAFGFLICLRGRVRPRFIIFTLIILSVCVRIIWRCSTISNKELLINEEIRDKEVRVVGEDGAQLGVLSSKEALDIAVEKNLDLVKIAPQASPPVCKIMDYGKYRFEQAKRDKEAKKNQKIVELKEIRMSLNIDTHDFDTKVGHAKKFLTAGDKVKVSVRFRRAREMSHSNLANDLMSRFKDACVDIAQVDKPAKMEGRSLVLFLSPKATK